MKKYLIIIFVLFLLISIPVLASSLPTTVSVTNSPVKPSIIASTSSLLKKQIKILNQEIAQNLIIASNQLNKLVEIFRTNEVIGQKVNDIVQSELKTEIEITSDLEKLNSRVFFVKIFIGSDKKVVKSLTQKLDQNNSNIKQLEELKSIVKTQDEIQQFQDTIDLISTQNSLLQAKIDIENKNNGLFGWLINIFNKIN